jgi:type III pantothenate kinase
MSGLTSSAAPETERQVLVVADVGNTHTVLGFFEGVTLIHQARIESARGRTEDELHMLLRRIVTLTTREQLSVTGAAVGSVVPVLTEATIKGMRAAFGVEPLRVESSMDVGMKVVYDDPRTLGVDRFANALAAHERAKGAVIIVDLGTATKFDCVAADGTFLGGAIAPGMRIAAEALASRAAKLAGVPLVRPKKVVGRTTETSMQAGIIIGWAAMVDGMVERMRAELGPAKVIATGGLAPLIERDAESIDWLVPELTLEGLRIAHQRSRGAR